jgi:hypothetical protein
MSVLLDDAWNKLRNPPERYAFGAPKIVPEPEPEAVPLFELTPELIDAATVEERDAIISDLQKWDLLRLPFARVAIKFPQEPIAELLGWCEEAAGRGLWITMWCEAKGPLQITTLYTTKNYRDYRRDDVDEAMTPEALDKEVAAGVSASRRVVIPEALSAQAYLEGKSRIFRLPQVCDLREADASCVAERGYKSNFNPVSRDYQAMMCEAMTVLVASLAARNVVKDTRYNASRSINGRSEPYHLGGGDITYLSRTIVRPPRIDETSDVDPDHPPRAGLAKMLLVRGFIRNQVADTTKPQPEGVRVTAVGKGRAGRREQWIAPYYRGVDPEYVPTRHYVVRP